MKKILTFKMNKKEFKPLKERVGRPPEYIFIFFCAISLVYARLCSDFVSDVFKIFGVWLILIEKKSVFWIANKLKDHMSKNRLYIIRSSPVAPSTYDKFPTKSKKSKIISTFPSNTHWPSVAWIEEEKELNI